MRKIGFFLYSEKVAGVENYLVNLINSWPGNGDTIFIFINKNFKSIKKLKKKLRRKVIFFIYDDFLKYSFSNNSFFKKIIYKIKSVLFAISKKDFLFDIFNNLNLDNFLIVNGGYPGAIYNLLVAKSWKKFKFKKTWMVIHNYPKKYNYLNFINQTIIDYIISKNLTGIITVSKSGLNSLKDRNFIKNLKIRKIYNGVKKLKINKSYKTKNKFKIIMIAVFEERKGFEFIFRSLKILKKEFNKFKFYLYGDYSHVDKTKIKRLILKYEITENVIIKKYTTQKSKIFENKDLLVLPSKYEIFGLSIIEAMMFKIPVIASNVGGPKEIIRNGKTGFLVNYNNDLRMANRIKKISNNKKLYNFIVKNAYREYLKKYNSENMSQKYYNLLK